MDLIAFVGNDKENWGQIAGLINRVDSNVILVVEKGVKGFPSNSKTVVVDIDSSKPLIELKDDIVKKVKGKIGNEFDVGLSLASGGGKEHMALISALLAIPVGIRIVVFTKNGVEFV
tara:strand:+ start:982 stop:1332 length:351 start_codon:yes stop_codon:yes gene_type:complete